MGHHARKRDLGLVARYNRRSSRAIQDGLRLFAF